MRRFPFLSRRPLPTSVVVLLTAIVAAAGGYALAASRPAPPGPKEAPLVIQSWIAETPLPDATGRQKAPGKALADPPANVTATATMVLASPSDFGSGGIQALPAGRYLVYANCKTVDAPPEFKDVTVSLNLSYSGRTDYTSLPCPARATAPVLRVNAAQDVVVHGGFDLNLTDPERATDAMWSTDIGVAVFFVPEG